MPNRSLTAAPTTCAAARAIACAQVSPVTILRVTIEASAIAVAVAVAAKRHDGSRRTACSSRSCHGGATRHGGTSCHPHAISARAPSSRTGPWAHAVVHASAGAGIRSAVNRGARHGHETAIVIHFAARKPTNEEHGHCEQSGCGDSHRISLEKRAAPPRRRWHAYIRLARRVPNYYLAHGDASGTLVVTHVSPHKGVRMIKWQLRLRMW